MAKTGILYGEIDEYGFQLKAEWTQEITDSDTSNITINLYVISDGSHKLGSYNSVAYSRASLDIMWGNLGKEEFKFTPNDITKAGTYLLGTGTWTDLAHTAYGEPRDCYVTASLKYYVDDTHDSSYIQIREGIEDELSWTKLSTAICPTSYLGDTATIVVSKKSTSSLMKHRLRYEIGGMTGNISYIISDLSIDWQIPFDFLPLFGDTEFEKKGTLYCDTYYQKSSSSLATLVGTTQSEFTVLLDGSTYGPQFNATIKDTNPTTLALTGNESTLVRFYSNAYVDTGAIGQGNATVVSQSVVCGNQTLLAGKGTIPSVESKEFVMSATDSRGLTAIQTVIAPFVEYSKLTCNVFTSPVETDGDLTFKINGNYFKGSFGAVDNTLTVLYRYKIKDGEYTDWLTATASPSSSNYEVSITLTGMDYTQAYVIQAKASDKLITIESAEMTAVGSPVFDWSKEDFNFNVPVTAQESITLAVDKAIFGTDSNGDQVVALTPKTSTGELILGYGNYQQESGSTKIYGNGIDLISNGDITLNGASVNDLGLAKTGTWQPVCNACSLATYALGNYIRIGNICIVNFFFQGAATSEPLYIEFSGLPYTPDTNYRWQAGGGCASGYKVSAASHVFNGWSIEQGKIYGKTIYTGSSAGSVAVTGYITASQGVSIYASGTIMYKIAEG